MTSHHSAMVAEQQSRCDVTSFEMRLMIRKIIPSESDVQSLIQQILAIRRDVKFFRNNVGVAAAYDFKKKCLRIPIQFIRYGLRNGSSDLIGWKTITVTHDMVGKKIAIFTAIELKKPKKGVLSDEQIEFIKNVKEAGGIAFSANSELDLKELDKQF